MDIKLLKNSIFQNNIPNLMIFNVKESMLSKQYIDSIAKTLNVETRYFDKADEVIYNVTSNMREDFLYIIYNDESVLKNINYIEELNKFRERHIIIYFNDLDTKENLYKTYKDLVVTFEPLDKYTLVAYLMKQLDKNKIEVSQERIEKLVDFCDCRLGCCLNELDKIITLEQASSNMLVDYMFNNGFSDYRNTNVYSFVNKILNKDKSVFEDKFRFNDNIVSLLTILYNYTESRIKINYSDMRLADILELVSKLDSGIKDGTLNGDYILDYLLLKAV